MLTRWLTLALVAATWRAADACSCMPQHPQTHFCKSDFVIVGRVQKLFRGNDTYDAYKVKIRNIYKTTPKAVVALKSGRLLTASHEALCGVSLQPRETYVITGNVVHLQAHIDFCGYVNKWRDVTPRQRKGFRLLYKQGCTCKVHVTRRRTKSPNTCVTNYDDCFERHGICLHDRDRRCRWTRLTMSNSVKQCQNVSRWANRSIDPMKKSWFYGINRPKGKKIPLGRLKGRLICPMGNTEIGRPHSRGVCRSRTSIAR